MFEDFRHTTPGSDARAVLVFYLNQGPFMSLQGTNLDCSSKINAVSNHLIEASLQFLHPVEDLHVVLH